MIISYIWGRDFKCPIKNLHYYLHKISIIATFIQHCITAPYESLKAQDHDHHHLHGESPGVQHQEHQHLHNVKNDHEGASLGLQHQDVRQPPLYHSCLCLCVFPWATLRSGFKSRILFMPFWKCAFFVCVSLLGPFSDHVSSPDFHHCHFENINHCRSFHQSQCLNYLNIWKM